MPQFKKKTYNSTNVCIEVYFMGFFFIQTVSIVGLSLKLLPDGPVYPVGTCGLFHVSSMSLGCPEVRKNS